MSRSFIPFALEREMSRWEKKVEYNISESGVYPMSLRELILDEDYLTDLLDTRLDYPHANGLPILRERIAALYEGATAENVIITVGGAQANYTILNALLEADDPIAVMMPNYLQLWGSAQNIGAQMSTFNLDSEDDWQLDLPGLRRAISPDTRLVCVCNPNNPTGHVLKRAEMRAICEAVEDTQAWLLVDEVYRGAERLSDTVTPSFWGQTERVVITGSLSKAFGLPGLRLGWLVAPPEIIEKCWAHQDYITICATMLANHLAAYALEPTNLTRIRQRTRTLLQSGYATLEEWGKEQGGRFAWVPPDAGAIVSLRYSSPLASEEYARQLANRESTYAAPGAHFGIEQHLRISYGLPPDYLREALDRVARIMTSVV